MAPDFAQDGVSSHFPLVVGIFEDVGFSARVVGKNIKEGGVEGDGVHDFVHGGRQLSSKV